MDPTDFLIQFRTEFVKIFSFIFNRRITSLGQHEVDDNIFIIIKIILRSVLSNVFFSSASIPNVPVGKIQTHMLFVTLHILVVWKQ